MFSLLITVAIIAILAAIIVPTVIKYVGSESTTEDSTIAAGVTAAAKAEEAIVVNAVLTAMTDAKVTSIGGTGPFTVDKNNDLDAETGGKTGTYLVGKYLTGGIRGLKGAYSVTSAGEVTQISYSQSDELSNNRDSTPKLDLPIGLPTFAVPQPPDLNPGKLIPTAIPSVPSIPFP